MKPKVALLNTLYAYGLATSDKDPDTLTKALEQ
jgi:hypothetical protein